MSLSFEETAHQLKQPFLFIDLRNISQPHWLRGKFVSVALGRFENAASWSQILDAFFYWSGGTCAVSIEAKLKFYK